LSDCLVGSDMCIRDWSIGIFVYSKHDSQIDELKKRVGVLEISMKNFRGKTSDIGL
jgi:hypothetical protein